MILRDPFLLESINCSPMTYGMECSRTNDHFGKNKDRSEIKAHHYIISFDPRDRNKPIRGQSLGTDFEKAALMYFFIEKEKQSTINQPKISKSQKLLTSGRTSIGLITNLHNS